MNLIPTLTLATLLACHAVAGAQSARVKRHDPIAPGQGGNAGGGERAGDQDDASPAGEDRVYTSHEVTRKAVINSRPNPDYPREARRREVQGTVRLRIILRADGHVDDHVEVQESLPDGATEAAIKAARRIVFEPALKGDHKVSQYVIIEYNFRIY
jgi:protein TonB